MEKIFQILNSKFGFLLISVIIFYLLGSFITFDLNPMHWWLFSTMTGRIVFVIIAIVYISNTFSDETFNSNQQPDRYSDYE